MGKTGSKDQKERKNKTNNYIKNYSFLPIINIVNNGSKYKKPYKETQIRNTNIGEECQ